MPDMKTLRSLGIIVAIALVAIGVAVLPSGEDAPRARPCISVGAAADGAAPGSESMGVSDGSVPLPSAKASEQSAGGVHSDAGVGSMEAEASPEPSGEPSPAREQSGSSSSAGDQSTAPSDSSSSRPGQSTRPPGVCEWDDGELECDDEDDHDHDDDDDRQPAARTPPTGDVVTSGIPPAVDGAPGVAGVRPPGVGGGRAGGLARLGSAQSGAAIFFKYVPRKNS